MLAAVYHQLFIMSIIVGGLYLLLKILSPLTVRSFTASWHYWSYLPL